MTRQQMMAVMKSSNCQTSHEQIDLLKKEIQKRAGHVGNFPSGISQTINRFKSDYKTRWEAAYRMKERFLKNNQTWLDTSISIFSLILKRSGPGRPLIPFEECTKKIKAAKCLDLRKSKPLPKLTYATQMELKAARQREASKLIENVLSDSSKASEYTKAYRQSIETMTMSGEDALALIVEARLSRHQYNIVRSKAPKIYPSYKVI